MAHFAQIDDNNVVQQVIVISNDDAPDPFPESELLGQQFIAGLGFPGVWKQTSYHATFRKHYAGIGYSYDAELDAFIPPKKFASWVLDEDTCTWAAPTPAPDDGQFYHWDEETLSWILIELPEE